MSGFLRGFRFWRPSISVPRVVISLGLNFSKPANSQYLPLVMKDF